jgi:class 3 adenylate cyclase/tetratricopeptide (TPR) repeat protein
LASLCARCGQINIDGSSLCSGCGGFLLADTTHAERRQVTALSFGLVDFISLTVRLSPDDLMQVIDTYLAACDDIVSEFGGQVMQYMGDGVMAYFGYPRANEDDPANAVRAAIKLRDTIGQLELPAGATLHNRIGIATGLIVVSELVRRREGRGGGIVGETPNLAARLQSAAEPDTVVVSDTTRRIVSGQFTFRDLGAFPLKGYPTLVPAYEAVEVPPIVSRFQARIRGDLIPMVGRGTEMGALRAIWDDVCGGRGNAVLLRGEPGIGKSRLVEELRRNVADMPHIQFAWYCGPNTSDSALHPIIEQFTRAAGFGRGDTAETRRAKLAPLFQRFGLTDPVGQAVIADLLGVPPADGSAAAALTPDRRKAITLDTLLDMMAFTASMRPALFVLEDLHWCDSTTLELLDRALARTPDHPWLILCTARPESETSWPSGKGMTTIELGRLDRGNAEQICRHLGAEGLLPADAVRQIVERCDGIPLFVEEMTRSVLEATVDASSVAAIPASVRDSLVSRLDRLGSARRVACLGAAIGRRFRYDLLAAVAAMPEATLREDLRELTRSGLVERSGVPPTSAYLFKHALIRDAAYDSLLRRERETLHGQIAAVLRDRFAETRETEPELIAYHLTESGALADAIPLWASAGQRASSRAAHVEAVGHLQTALTLLRRGPADAGRMVAELPLLIGLAVSLSASRGYTNPDVAKVLAEARGICDAMGNVSGLFAVLRGICSFAIVAGNPTVAEDAARRCMAIADETNLIEHRIESDATLGYILYVRGNLATARFHLERAARLYTENDGTKLIFPSPQDPLIVSLSTLIFVRHAMDDDDGAERANETLTSHARSLGRSFDLAWALTFQSHYRQQIGQPGQALALRDEMIRICSENGYEHWRIVGGMFRAICAGHLGHAADALATAEMALIDLDRVGDVHWRALYLGEIARLHSELGDNRTALATIEAAIAKARDSGEHCFLSPLLRRKAEILTRMADAGPAAAHVTLGEAVAIAEAQGAVRFVRDAQILANEAAIP